MKTTVLFPAVLGLMAIFARESHAEPTYAKQHELLVAAIKNGSASGLMTGELADLFSRQFNSVGVLRANAKVVRSFPQPDCKRIEIIYTKADVMTKSGPEDDIKLKLGLNYCLDGRPPAGAPQ